MVVRIPVHARKIPFSRRPYKGPRRYCKACKKDVGGEPTIEGFCMTCRHLGQDHVYYERRRRGM